MNKPPTIRQLVSAGGIVYRCPPEGIEVALVAVKDRGIWCLPKGVVEEGEETDKTALREVHEETGLSGEILDKVGMISYWYYADEKTVRVHKTVHYFLMRYTSGRTEDHDAEVDDARWFPVDEAINVLVYKGERAVLLKARKMIEGMVSETSREVRDQM
jgi:8-oxo-dGTP pyrophosphatase MutT (NUDIX family)